MVCPGTTGVRDDVTVRIPKSTVDESLTAPPTRASAARWYIGWPPIWYGHQTAGCLTCRGPTVTVTAAFGGTVTVRLNRRSAWCPSMWPEMLPVRRVVCGVAV